MAITELPEPISREEMKKNEVPIAFRDRCAGLLIPLNKCRKEGWYMPWNCVEERHDYEHCQYLDFKRRVRELEEFKKVRDSKE
ncbi:DEKNAAC102867 [Brettanomyces naardenensis]|uniref:NADH dehydrogenase [ubiquinone] 1 beta subcomplex subunit 7 n=1 Tax=Brettanomyces naardenensis TaxID=13370 RepID=A0A448YLV0_BRENA|nr:DEKNAAC102867 [Brettanomyces naardenensis]